MSQFSPVANNNTVNTSHGFTDEPSLRGALD